MSIIKPIAAFIVARPLLSHGLLGFVDFVVLGLAILHPALGAVGLWLAALLISVFYYGREAGQREHDLIRAGTEPVKAWLGASFMFGWSRDNLWQWVVPTVVVIVAALSSTVAFAVSAH